MRGLRRPGPCRLLLVLVRLVSRSGRMGARGNLRLHHPCCSRLCTITDLSRPRTPSRNRLKLWRNSILEPPRYYLASLRCRAERVGWGGCCLLVTRRRTRLLPFLMRLLELIKVLQRCPRLPPERACQARLWRLLPWSLRVEVLFGRVLRRLGPVGRSGLRLRERL